jgi:hypothetical protein
VLSGEESAKTPKHVFFGEDSEEICGKEHVTGSDFLPVSKLRDEYCAV